MESQGNYSLDFGQIQTAKHDKSVTILFCGTDGIFFNHKM